MQRWYVAHEGAETVQQVDVRRHWNGWHDLRTGVVYRDRDIFETEHAAVQANAQRLLSHKRRDSAPK
jgi:hypothetical protein